MSLRNPEVGYENGLGRAMGPGDQNKVRQAVQQLSYKVATDQLRKQQYALTSGEKTHTKAPPTLFAKELWYPKNGEPAVRLRDNMSDEVFTALNGIDDDACSVYPDDEEMARLIVRSKVQLVGIVDQDARTDMKETRVTVQFAGTVSQIAPGQYNIPGREGAEIQLGNTIVYDVPNLTNPIVAGFPGQIGKIVMIPCVVTKESIAARVLTLVGHIIHDPARYKRAMGRYEYIANANMNAALALKNAAIVNGLMMVDLLLKRGVLTLSAETPELTRGVDSAATTAELAEALSLIYPGEHNIAQPGAFAGKLTTAQVQKWNKIEFDLSQRLFPVPNPSTGKINARTEFGMTVDALGTPVSSGRSLESGEILRTPIGNLLSKSLTSTSIAIQSLAYAIDEETRNRAGIAMSTPNQSGTGIFSISLGIQGGMTAKNI